MSSIPLSPPSCLLSANPALRAKRGYQLFFDLNSSSLTTCRHTRLIISGVIPALSEGKRRSGANGRQRIISQRRKGGVGDGIEGEWN